jgi:hypothetical protein
MNFIGDFQIRFPCRGAAIAPSPGFNAGNFNFPAAERRLSLARRLWSLRINCNYVGADTQACPGAEDPPLRGRHAGLPLRWIAWLHLFLKDHQRREWRHLDFPVAERRLTGLSI